MTPNADSYHLGTSLLLSRLSANILSSKPFTVETRKMELTSRRHFVLHSNTKQKSVDLSSDPDFQVG